VVENEVRRDTLAFQVDLWNARGVFRVRCLTS